MICPDCNSEMIRIAARIEGAWKKAWLCKCKATEEEIQRWESERMNLIKKHWNPSEQEKILKEKEGIILERK